MSDFLPDGWAIDILDNLTNSITVGHVGSTSEYYRNEGVLFLRTGNLNSGKINLTDAKYITREFHESLKKSMLYEGDILVSRVGYTGNAAIVPCHFPESNCANIIIIRANETIFPEYLHLFINSPIAAKQNASFSVGSAQSVLNIAAIKKLEAVIPPLSEQQKIAAILISVDEVIEKTQAQCDKLKDLKTAMMQELLTKGVGIDGNPHTEFKDSPVGRIPKGWEVATLGNITLESAFGPRFSSEEYALDGNIGCIRTTDMDENWDINYSTAPLARLNFQEFEKHILVDGDLLVTRSGTCGLVDVYKEQLMPMVAAAFLIRFRLNKTVNPFFVRYLMMSSSIQKNIQLLASGGVQKNLSGTSLKTLKIPKPSIDEQDQIVRVLESINDRISILNKKLKSNLKLKKALMQDLLTGKVRVTVPTPSSTKAS